MVEVRCKTCDQGFLSTRKVYRMSGPSITIGYILLIPSLLGIAASVIFFLATVFGAASAAQHGLTDEMVTRLRNADVPPASIAKLQAGEQLSESEKSYLNSEQLSAVRSAESQLDAAIGAVGCIGACGTGVAAVVAVLSFVGGLVGWLLIMKKRVLMCSTCGAVTSAD